MKKPSVISKLKSPRKFRTEVAEETVLQQPIEVANKRPSSRSGGSTRAIEEVIEYPIDQANGRQSSRSGRSTRRSRIEIVDTEGSDLGMADTGRTTRPRDHSYQHKRKALEPIAGIPQLDPEPMDPLPISTIPQIFPVPIESHPIPTVPQIFSEPIDPHPISPIPRSFPEPIDPHPVISQNPDVQAPEAAGNSSSAPRRARRKNIDSTEGPDWVQYMVDMIMWQDTPKTAFLFGFGSFCVLSSSYAQDMHFSLITTLSYLALVYLAAVFLYKTIFRRGAIEQNCRPKNYELISEADALWILRFVLPVVNVLLAKFRDLFSGDPATTIKLASFLWLLAQCGHTMTVWTLARVGFFAIFIIPKLYTCYSAQFRGYGQFMLDRFWDAWNTCSHKKGVLVAVFLMAWNLSSVAARVWGAFILIVALRLYQQSLRTDPENIVPPQEDIQIPEKSATDITGLELIKMEFILPNNLLVLLNSSHYFNKSPLIIYQMTLKKFP